MLQSTICMYLVKLFSHFANDISMLHIMVHVRCNAATAARTVNEELYEFQQRSIAILLVRLNPFINNRLVIQYTGNRSNRFSNTPWLSPTHTQKVVMIGHISCYQDCLCAAGFQKLHHSPLPTDTR